jgi:hypothetical protein
MILDRRYFLSTTVLAGVGAAVASVAAGKALALTVCEVNQPRRPDALNPRADGRTGSPR